MKGEGRRASDTASNEAAKLTAAWRRPRAEQAMNRPPPSAKRRRLPSAAALPRSSSVPLGQGSGGPGGIK